MLVLSLTLWLASQAAPSGPPVEPAQAAAGAPVSAEKPAREAPFPLERWQQASSGARFEPEGPAMRTSGRRGWTRTQTEFLDFAVQMQFRLSTADAAGAVLVRAWTSERDGWPSTGYRVGFSRKAGGLTEIRGLSTKLQTVPSQPSGLLNGPEAWHDLEIECYREHVMVKVDGQVVSEVDGREPEAGYIGLEHDSGIVEFRNMRVAVLPVARKPEAGDSDRDEKHQQPAGLKKPTVQRAVKPRYSIAAMKAHIEGTVVLECVLDEDGRSVDERIDSSVDPELDAEAVAAARQWRFHPALIDGKPTPMIITLELRFTLGR
jgi:TonB family protein